MQIGQIYTENRILGLYGIARENGRKKEHCEKMDKERTRTRIVQIAEGLSSYTCLCTSHLTQAAVNRHPPLPTHPLPTPRLHPFSTLTHASRTPTVNTHAATSWTMCSWGAIQRAAAMRVTRCAHTSSDTRATMPVHQMSFNPPADSPFRSRSYATFVTDQELQQARAEMEECYRRRARRAGLEDTLPVGRPMIEEEIEDLQWQLGDFGPASRYGSRGKEEPARRDRHDH
jgi:hypothetical protein